MLQDTSEGWHEGENDYSAFVKYLLGIVLAAYKDFEDRVNLFSEKLSSYDLVKRATTKKIGDFTKSEILELCPGIRSSSVEAALKKLVEEGYLTRTGQARSTRYALAKESPKEKKKRPKNK